MHKWIPDVLNFKNNKRVCAYIYVLYIYNLVMGETFLRRYTGLQKNEQILCGKSHENKVKRNITDQEMYLQHQEMYLQ